MQGTAESLSCSRPACPSSMPALLDEVDVWRVIRTRDASLDGRVFYGVTTTRIFCRPSCASRRPRREHVVLFASIDAAHAAGYRACLRCTPTQRAAAPPGLALARAVASAIEADREGTLTLAKLAREHGTSASRVQRTFSRFAGVSPREYANALKIARVRRGLGAGKTVRNAAHGAGFGSTSRVYERARRQLGMTPGALARGAAQQGILFASAACHLGVLLVATTRVGVCAVALGASAAVLERSLRASFPKAHLRPDPVALATTLNAILDHLAGKRPHLELPRDVQATAFQRLVWAELSKIPHGETRTYADVAAALGKPEAVRAVARACASNPTALLIPCHRVLRADGDLAGYRWGLERKRALLERETEVAGSGKGP